MDLTAGLLALASNASDRRHARRDLIEATDLVAREITKLLRSEDMVEVDGHLYRVARLTWPEAVEDTPVSVLTRDGFALHDERQNGAGGQVKSTTYVDPFTRVAVPFADLDRRAAFADEAGEVIAAFADLTKSQAIRYTAAAQTIVKMRPR
jgi:hypothetical protein